MKIVKLESKNVMRLTAVSITPKGNLVVIGGQNEQGKTSVLDSIMMGLGGKATVCEQPIHKGAEKGEILIDLGEFIVRRVFTAAGSTITITNAAGNAKFASPQAMLDGIVGKLAFDPLAFSKDKDQVNTLKQLVGVDFSDIDGRRKKLYDDRTDVNKEIKRLQVMIEQTPEQPNANESEVSTNDMTAKLTAAYEINEANDIERGKLVSLEQTYETREREFHNQETEVARIAEQLRLAQESLIARHAAAEDVAAMLEAQRSKVASLVDADIRIVREEIQTIERGNEAWRQNQRLAKLVAELADQKALAEAKSGAITACDVEKAEVLANVKFPIEELSFADDTVLYKGIPFSQCSSAEKLRVSVAIGLAMNPELRVVLIRDGSLLDENNLKLVAEMAEAADAQVWMERVGEGLDAQVIIEDGHVKGVEPLEEPVAVVVPEAAVAAPEAAPAE